MYSPGRPTSPHLLARRRRETPAWSRFCCHGGQPLAASLPPRAHAPASLVRWELQRRPPAAPTPCHTASASPASRCSRAPLRSCSHFRELTSSPRFHPTRLDRLRKNAAPPRLAVPPPAAATGMRRSSDRCSPKAV